METLREDRKYWLQSILGSADCAIGIEAASMVLKGLDGFREDYISHIKDHHCVASIPQTHPLCGQLSRWRGYSRLCGVGGRQSVMLTP